MPRLSMFLLSAVAALSGLLTFGSAETRGQDTLWNTWRKGGLQALHEGRLADAVRLLIAALEQQRGCNLIALEKQFGETTIEGSEPLDRPAWKWPSR